MPIVTRGGNILLRNGAIATSTACCCGPPPDPCYVLIGGTRVPVTSLVPENVLDVSVWGGAVPDGTVTRIRDGELLYQYASGWEWQLYVEDTGFTSLWKSDVKYFSADPGKWTFPVPPGYGYSVIGGLIKPKQISATECIIYGHVVVLYNFDPGSNAGTPRDCAAKLDYNMLWRWQCTLTDSIPGPVSVVPVLGYRITYAADANGDCQNITDEVASIGPTPTVTLTFAP